MNQLCWLTGCHHRSNESQRLLVFAQLKLSISGTASNVRATASHPISARCAAFPRSDFSSISPKLARLLRLFATRNDSARRQRWTNRSRNAAPYTRIEPERSGQNSKCHITHLSHINCACACVRAAWLPQSVLGDALLLDGIRATTSFFGRHFSVFVRRFVAFITCSARSIILIYAENVWCGWCRSCCCLFFQTRFFVRHVSVSHDICPWMHIIPISCGYNRFVISNFIFDIWNLSIYIQICGPMYDTYMSTNEDAVPLNV